MWAQLAATILGIWLTAAPQVLEYAGPARTNDHIVGPLAATFACVAIWDVTRPVRWANLVLGAWLVLSPWLLGYGGMAAWHSLGVGVLLGALACIRGMIRHQIGDGWSALWRPQLDTEPR